MIGALPLPGVRQQQDHTRNQAPLSLTRNDEFVDDHLRGVDEVAILSFPQDERSWGLNAVAILKTERCVLRKRAVENLERRAFVIFRKLRQRRELSAGA